VSSTDELQTAETKAQNLQRRATKGAPGPTSPLPALSKAQWFVLRIKQPGSRQKWAAMRNVPSKPGIWSLPV
jgi:hypothetical protein